MPRKRTSAANRQSTKVTKAIKKDTKTTNEKTTRASAGKRKAPAPAKGRRGQPMAPEEPELDVPVSVIIRLVFDGESDFDTPGTALGDRWISTLRLARVLDGRPRVHWARCIEDPSRVWLVLGKSHPLLPPFLPAVPRPSLRANSTPSSDWRFKSVFGCLQAEGEGGAWPAFQLQLAAVAVAVPRPDVVIRPHFWTLMDGLVYSDLSSASRRHEVVTFYFPPDRAGFPPGEVGQGGDLPQGLSALTNPDRWGDGALHRGSAFGWAEGEREWAGQPTRALVYFFLWGDEAGEREWHAEERWFAGDDDPEPPLAWDWFVRSMRTKGMVGYERVHGEFKELSYVLRRNGLPLD